MTRSLRTAVAAVACCLLLGGCYQGDPQCIAALHHREHVWGLLGLAAGLLLGIGWLVHAVGDRTRWKPTFTTLEVVGMVLLGLVAVVPLGIALDALGDSLAQGHGANCGGDVGTSQSFSFIGVMFVAAIVAPIAVGLALLAHKFLRRIAIGRPAAPEAAASLDPDQRPTVIVAPLTGRQLAIRVGVAAIVGGAFVVALFGRPGSSDTPTSTLAKRAPPLGCIPIRLRALPVHVVDGRVTLEGRVRVSGRPVQHAPLIFISAQTLQRFGIARTGRDGIARLPLRGGLSALPTTGTIPNEPERAYEFYYEGPTRSRWCQATVGSAIGFVHG